MKPGAAERCAHTTGLPGRSTAIVHEVVADIPGGTYPFGKLSIGSIVASKSGEFADETGSNKVCEEIAYTHKNSFWLITSTTYGKY